jgi:hypothetical protein
MLWQWLADADWYTHVSSPVTTYCRKASPSQYHCKICMYISVCSHLSSSISCFGTHLANILGYLRSLWMMEYAYPVSVQLVSYISDSNPSVLMNQSINLFNTVHHSWNCQTAWAVFINDICSATSEPFHPLVLLPLHNTVFSILQ